MKATRHNGRSGKHGTYDAKHNDRRFDVENSEHIDAERTKFNVYWDCYQGYSLPNDENERAKFTFTEVEKTYYVEKYSDHVDGQNERNRKARHYDRVKTIDGILENNKTCPEETLLQLGNIDGTVSADVLAQISAEYFEEFNKRYGSHVHILDWALHLDEATPHIHERHVFDVVNQYGELCPQQDKALEELEFELPKPNEKKGKYNNRKMVFDDENSKASTCVEKALEIWEQTKGQKSTQLMEAQTKLETVKHQLETAKVEVTKPFAQEAELAEKLERLSALNALLNMDEKGNDGIDMDDEPEAPKSEEEVADRPAKHITLAEKTVGTRSDKGIRQYADAPAERVSLKAKLEVMKAKVAGGDTEKPMPQKVKGKEVIM